MTKTRSACFILLLAASQPFLSPILYAQDLFTITDLGTLGGTSSSASGVSDYGQVVGTSTTAYGVSRAFTWWNGVMYDLGTLGGGFSSASAINNQGQVVGVAATATGDQHAFLFQGSTMTDLGTLGGSSSAANAINDLGQIVGSSALANGQTRAFAWVDGAMTDLGALGPGATRSSATGINNSGAIVGGSNVGSLANNPNLSAGFLFTDQMYNLNAQFGYGNSGDPVVAPTAINNSNQIVGSTTISATLGEGSSAFFLSAGVPTSVALPGGFPTRASLAAINDAGLAVGYTQATATTFPNVTSIKAMAYYQGTTFDLNTLVDLSGTNFIGLNYATGINNAFQIVGTGTMKDGSTHAFLLTPIPTPSVP